MIKMSGNLILSALLWIYLVQFAAAQNTLVIGQFGQVGPATTIDLHVNQYYLTDQNDTYSSNVLEDGSFAFATQINEPQLVTLKYGNDKALIYLEPGDTLSVYTDAEHFLENIRFEGRGGPNNKLLYAYYTLNPPELDQFKMVQYRYGNFWYSNNPRMEDLMLTSGREKFTRQILLEKEKALDLLQSSGKRDPGVTENFKAFLETEINYYWAYHMMLYGHVFKNKYQLKENYFNFTTEVSLDNNSIGNYWLRKYLLAFVNHLNEAKPKTSPLNPFVAQYDIATNSLYNKAKSFVQSEMIVRALRAAQFDQILPKYHEFSRNNPYVLLEHKVISVYQKTIRYAPGSQAPDFALADVNGQSRNLSEFRGKVVYLNFWASWCRPCIAKMKEMRPLQAEMEKKGVAFLNVSLDKNEISWKNKIEEIGLRGVNVRVTGASGQALLKEYEVKVLPQYYLIDKKGAFAEKPRRFSPVKIRSSLSELIAEPSN